MNLSVEYCRRHKMSCVFITNQSVCFFNKFDRPHLAATISAPPKTNSLCSVCEKDTGLVVEVISSAKALHLGLDSHQHVNPDADLLPLMMKIDPYLKPVFLKNDKEIEEWVWRFYSSENIKSAAWKKLISEQSGSTQARSYEQMYWTATNSPGHFNYFHTFYQSLVAGRKYLLQE